MDGKGRLRARIGLQAIALALALSTVAVACTQVQQNGTERTAPATPSSVATSGPSQVEQLVLQIGRHYVRWTPASNRPTRILPARRMQAQAIASSGDRIYWLHRSPRSAAISIQSISANGHRPVTLVENVGSFAITIAATRRHVYWGSATGAIGRVAIDGSRLQRRWLAAGQDGLTTDGRFLYLSQCFRGRIGRVPLTGPTRNRQIEWIVQGSNTCPQALAVDGGFVYWAGFTRRGAGPGVIGRAPVDGGVPEDTWTDVETFNGPISLATADGFVYWDWGGTPNSAPSFLGRVNVDGSGFTRKVRRIGPGPITTITRPAS